MMPRFAWSTRLQLPRARPASMRKFLQGTVNQGGECLAEELVLAKGRDFVGIQRPKRLRLMAAKQCLRNAFILASEERGNYCEGFAMSLQPGSLHFSTRG
jgi:hypothetical protein